MSNTVYINGRYLPEHEACIPLMDRSFLFGDGIYEVCAVVNGKMLDNDAHLARLGRSLNEIDIQNPYSNSQWIDKQVELITRNSLAEGIIYIQVSRGIFEREFVSPDGLKPSVVMFTQKKIILDAPLAKIGAKVITVPDQRWERRDIKSVSLLAQVLAKRASHKAGAHEAWMMENGFVTEGASSSAFIITCNQQIVTRPLSNDILPGITRIAVLKLSKDQSLEIKERPFSFAEALNANEAFYTSASSLVMPVISIDGHSIGSGVPGKFTLMLRDIYINTVLQSSS